MSSSVLPFPFSLCWPTGRCQSNRSRTTNSVKLARRWCMMSSRLCYDRASRSYTNVICSINAYRIEEKKNYALPLIYRRSIHTCPIGRVANTATPLFSHLA
ncbi:hypothetical protein K449DRAFT_40671 [Hypoxylon sp. EC38]|nr:hypothetical protein K449DRAFT_40671 [Hypoxylon sp. EC38]